MLTAIFINGLVLKSTLFQNLIKCFVQNAYFAATLHKNLFTIVQFVKRVTTNFEYERIKFNSCYIYKSLKKGEVLFCNLIILNFLSEFEMCVWENFVSSLSKTYFKDYFITKCNIMFRLKCFLPFTFTHKLFYIIVQFVK